jgi:hypothetical protein
MPPFESEGGSRRTGYVGEKRAGRPLDPRLAARVSEAQDPLATHQHSG